MLLVFEIKQPSFSRYMRSKIFKNLLVFEIGKVFILPVFEIGEVFVFAVFKI